MGRVAHHLTRLWQEPLFFLLLAPVGLALAWQLAGMILDGRPGWRRASRLVIGTLALADVAFITFVAVAMSHTHGCPINGCD
jgi:hypothetical protein